MIIIQEICPPIKVSGRSSFLVSFPYREDIVQALKTLPNYYYHKKILAWEIPDNHLGKLIDTLTFLDEIQLSFTEIEEISAEDSGGPLTSSEIDMFKYKPFKHQIEAINFGLTQKNKWLLLDSMGLGKTNEIIWLAETLKRRGLIKHCFIVCGVNALKQNWKKEIAKFSTESSVVLGEKISKTGKISYASVAERAKQLKEPIKEFFVITNIETLRDDRIIDAFKKSENQFDLIAVDEVHRCLTGDTVVKTSEGDMSIGQLATLVEGHYPLILSYNTTTGKDSYQKIEGVTQLTPSENLLELIAQDDNKIYTLHCTESHKIYTNNRGWVKAKDLTKEDDIKIISPNFHKDN